MRINYREYELNRKEKIHFGIISYGVTFILILIFYHSIALSMVGGFLCIFALPIYKENLIKKRQDLLLVQFKDLLYSLSSSFQGGRSMKAALEEGILSLKMIYKEETPLILELEYIVRGTGENHSREIDLFEDFALRSGLEDIRSFITVYAACQETGGDVIKAALNASSILVDKMSIETEIKALTAQKQFEGKIITIMPIAIVFLLNVFSPSYLEEMYTTIVGRIIMTLALLGIVMAYWLTNKFTKIEV